AKTNQQETNRRIDELKKDLRELLEAKFKVIDSQFKVVDSQFEVVGVRFQKLEGDVAEVRQEVQDLKKVIFKPAAWNRPSALSASNRSYRFAVPTPSVSDGRPSCSI